ncbi:iron-sulfur cluster assembly accessory protein [Simkania negevensis]|uniref:Iron-sulfur cluster assembly accessory protein n=1 Tax=Simkania negevensis TaxID=83561 RepID=A0ABS3ASB5_9BACT|nr:iron-sulfur cluster assembly accessory protein [Simkania negevensis]
MAIVRTMTIDEIFTLHPDKAQRLAQEMTNMGLHCVGCGAATWETLEAGMYGHSFGDDQVDGLIAKLNSILEETSDPDTITLTPFAASKYVTILEEEGKAGWGLRFEEKPGGCNGMEYLLDYSEKPSDGEEDGDKGDKVFVSEGVEIYVPKAQVEKLLGCVIDYVEGLQGAGFKISNPNVRSSCSCGTSHGY